MQEIFQPGSVPAGIAEGDTASKMLTPQCLFGNGACPQTCELYTQARELTEKLGERFMLKEARGLIMSADRNDRNIDAMVIDMVFDKCELEAEKESY